jgi:hypothetical protein
MVIAAPTSFRGELDGLCYGDQGDVEKELPVLCLGELYEIVHELYHAHGLHAKDVLDLAGRLDRAFHQPFH